jgi:hypothetical protein
MSEVEPASRSVDSFLHKMLNPIDFLRGEIYGNWGSLWMFNLGFVTQCMSNICMVMINRDRRNCRKSRNFGSLNSISVQNTLIAE